MGCVRQIKLHNKTIVGLKMGRENVKSFITNSYRYDSDADGKQDKDSKDFHFQLDCAESVETVDRSAMNMRHLYPLQ